ncbi:M4 family metallopeptidase [Actinoplanes bogorensis]|uniref:M4 family metallopeptidase n=1 Tax=Paractinoplanes bogorensis TaxID=1610840 RepID=A0ABS5YVH6_9ACTN|nr:M4 family metallopeptidase [Actinoplanes bogorensis]MBU2667451.1 M4 family metallopeptidase [Actinoplanes bogorensis]
MTVWRSHARGLVATVAAAALIGAGAAVAFSSPDEPSGTLSVSRRSPQAPASRPTPAPAAKPVEAGRSTPPAAKPAYVEAARRVVQANRTAVYASAGEKYQAKDIVVDKDGARHVRFQRTWHGLAVLGGDFVVHTAGASTLAGVSVAQRTAIDVARTPSVSKKVALAKAGTKPATARLVVDAFTGEPALAWEVTVDRRDVIVVDATTGAVRREYSLLQAADAGRGHGVQTGEVAIGTTRTGEGSFELIDAARGGNTTRDGRNNLVPTQQNSVAFTDADDVWGDGTIADRASAAVDAHYGMARTWDYFADTFGREGVAGDGKGVVAYVHSGVNEPVAYWSEYCRCLSLGDGFAASPDKPFTTIDLVAHELTHGLTSRSAGLVYTGESGALNEATSDIFGTLVEFAAANPADEPDYTIAEKVMPTGYLRTMDEPSRDGRSVSCWTADTRNANVHDASGVGNKFFYNLAVGSGTTQWGSSTPCNGAAPVTGIGNDAAGAIWYRALTAYMVSNTNYAGAREATLRAAADLYGTGSTERAAVQAAWLAAGVDGSDSVPTPPNAPVIDPFEPADAHVGRAVEARITARDPQRQTITWTATNLPAGLTISPAGVISGVPTVKDFYPVDLVATDPDGNSTTKRVSWLVKGPPELLGDAPGAQRLNVGKEYSLDLTFVDGGDFLSDSPAVMTVATSGVPEGLTATSAPNGNWVTTKVRGTPAAPGTGTMVFTVTDPDGDKLTVPVAWTVEPPAPPAMPVGAFVTGGNGTATVNWDDPYPPDGTPVTGYVVRVSPGTSQTLPASARSATLTGLDVTKAYVIGLRATSANGDGPEKVMSIVPTELPYQPLSLIAGYANPVTFTGQIVRQGTGLILGAEAFLEQKPAGATTWSRVGPVKTDISGTWTRTVNPTVNTQYRVVFPAGAERMWPATSAIATITVRYAVTVTPSTTTTTANTPVTFKGTIRPATPGVVAYLQRLTDGEWVTIQSTPNTAGGAYTISRGFPRGTWSLRMYASGGGTNGYGFTSAIRLTVN